MDIETTKTTAGLADLREVWERFERECPDATYYVAHRFVAAWWDAYSTDPGIELFVVCVMHNGEPVAIAPLAIMTREHREEPFREVRWASHGDYMTVLVNPEGPNVDTVLKELMHFLGTYDRWDRLNLRNVPGTSRFAGYLLRSQHNPTFTHHVENPYVDLRPYASFDAFEDEVVPKSARTYRNRFLRECEPTFRVLRGDEDDAFERIATLHRAEKRHLIEQGRTGRHSLYDDPRRSAHIRNVFRRTDDAITFVYEREDGGLYGYRTGFLDGRRLLSWNSAYDPDHEDHRVGKVLFYDVIRHLYEEDVADILDLGAGRYRWKFEWTSRFTTTYMLKTQVRRSTDDDDRSADAEPDGDGEEPDGDGEEPDGEEGDGEGAGEEAPSPTLVRRLKAWLPEPIKAPLRRLRNDWRDPDVDLATALRRRAPDRAKRAWRRRRARQQRRRLGRPVEVRHAPAIWYVPHPDDEALFMGGSLRSSRQRNIVVLLTRGGASNAIRKVNDRLEDGALDRQGFMEARVREFRASVRELGVDDRDVIVHDLPDGALDVDDVRGIVRSMERRYPGASHRTMSYLDPHRDHRTAGEALLAAHDDGEIARCTFHLPIPAVGEDLGTPVQLGDAALEAKRAAIRQYAEWRPEDGRYAIGSHSVAGYIERQLDDPTEHIHPPGYHP